MDTVKGNTVVEYTLIITFLIFVCIASLHGVTESIGKLVENYGKALEQAGH